MQKIFGWLSKLLRRTDSKADSPQSQLQRPEFWQKSYRDIILREGSVSSETRKSAEELGLDVDALLAEHERRQAASRTIDVDFDLDSLLTDENGWPLAEQFAAWEFMETPLIENGVWLEGEDFWGAVNFEHQSKKTVANLLRAGSHHILQLLKERKGELRYSYPLGTSDLIFTTLRWSGHEESWYLHVARKPEVLQRRPSQLHPDRSIDLLRAPYRERARIKAMSWPKLDHVWLSVDVWPSGKWLVWKAFETKEECGPDREASQPEQPHTRVMRYPCEGAFTWEEMWATTPAAHFLKEHAFQQMGELGEKIRAHSVEAVFCDYSKPAPAADYRASLRSGIHGPAPLPAGMPWPACPNCGEPALFAESLDFRDVAFAHLLPGSSISIFMCDDCLMAGEWTESARLVWLPNDQEVELVSHGDAASLIEARQWIGNYSLNMADLPEDLCEQMEQELAKNLPWVGVMAPEFGSKAGGLPNYLQQDQPMFDSTGCLMEYIGQFCGSDKVSFGGFGYIFHSTKTGETAALLQTT